MKNILILAIPFVLLACSVKAQKQQPKKDYKAMTNTKNLSTAIFANGCFWCTEAIFRELEGVEKVEAGYIGGFVENPTYKAVCTGQTGHAEALRIYFDASKTSFNELLDVFFATHNPTTLNRQGADVGTQYRSEIFYLNDAQKKASEKFIKALKTAKVFDDAIVTKISKATAFYKAEDYHQNYYNNNKSQGYCNAVINPKLQKFRKHFKEKLKK